MRVRMKNRWKSGSLKDVIIQQPEVREDASVYYYTHDCTRHVGYT